MAKTRKPQRCRGQVAASELSQMGVCERLVKFEFDHGKKPSARRLSAMNRGRRAHEQFYLERHQVGGTTGRCFVATLVFGEAPETVVLRRFRDLVLRRTRAGRRLILTYYGVGPEICRFLAANPGLLAIVRFVLRGVAWLAARLLKTQGRCHDG
jgi:hypothetical protein